jgi:hypothetical protein
MGAQRVASGVATAVAVAMLAASCGGNGDNGGSDDDAATEQSITTAPAESASDATDAPTPTSTENDVADPPAGGATTSCDAIFSMAEMEAFFAEQVELTEDANDDVGQLVCTWESVEDPDNLDDLAIQSLLVQFYSGSPIDGSAFFDPELYESPTPIDGIGDVAYATGTAGMDYFFIDAPVSGSLNYITFEMGADDALPGHTPADVEELFRLFHERVT